MMSEKSPRPHSVDGQDQVVKFRVGGIKYITSRSTLFSRGENMLTLMIDNDDNHKVGSFRDRNGYIFIDRDGDLFRYVLNYLRTGKLFEPENIPLAQLELEFDFYQIKRSPDDIIKLKRHNCEPDTTPLNPIQLGGEFDELRGILDRWRNEAEEWFETYETLIRKEILAAANNGDSSLTLSFNLSRGTTYYSICGNIKLPTKFVRADLWQEALVDIVQNHLGIRLSYRSYNTTVLGYSFDFVFTWSVRSDKLGQRDILAEISHLLNSWNIKPSQRRMVDSGCSVVRINLDP